MLCLYLKYVTRRIRWCRTTKCQLKFVLIANKHSAFAAVCKPARLRGERTKKERLAARLMGRLQRWRRCNQEKEDTLQWQKLIHKAFAHYRW